MCQRTGRSGDAPVPPAGWACTSSAPDGGHLGSGCGGTRREAAERSTGRERPGGGGRHCATRTWPGAETVSESRPAGVSDLVLSLDHRSLPRRASLAAAVLQWTDSANRPAVPLAVSRRPIIVQSNLRLSGLIRFDLSDSGRFWIFKTGLDLTHNTLMMLPGRVPGPEPRTRTGESPAPGAAATTKSTESNHSIRVLTDSKKLASQLNRSRYGTWPAGRPGRNCGSRPAARHPVT